MRRKIYCESLHYLQKIAPQHSLLCHKAELFLRQYVLNKTEIPYVEMFVTTRCNLRCKYCSNLIPYLTVKEDERFEDVTEDLRLLLEKVDCIYRLKIHGGEVFLHPELKSIVEFVDSQPKIKSVRIATNGSIVPSQEVLGCLANSKAVVQISDYSFTQNKREELLKALTANGVKYIFLEGQEWRDMGEVAARKESSYEECSIKRCVSLCDGKIYLCSRTAIIAKLGLCADEGINVGLPRREFAKELKKLYSGKYSSACMMCDGDTERAQIIKAGEQIV